MTSTVSELTSKKCESSLWNSGSDYDTWLDEFAKAAMDAHPEESQKWANDHAVLASNLMEHIEEYIIEDVEGALENIEDE
mgnify:CR=1 FL=1